MIEDSEVKKGGAETGGGKMPVKAKKRKRRKNRKSAKSKKGGGKKRKRGKGKRKRKKKGRKQEKLESGIADEDTRYMDRQVKNY